MTTTPIHVFVMACFLLKLAAGAATAHASAGEGIVTVRPAEYVKAFGNPLKGIRAGFPHPFATLNKTYLKWSSLEDRESDGVEKIRSYCDKIWQGYPEHNMKAIPRVWLHMPHTGEYVWPSDLQKGDYSSPLFKARVLRLVKKLGEAWDNDPRVAYVEMGIIGYWGEQHHPGISKEMEKLLGDAFSAAFKNKLVMVRYPKDFCDYHFGIYWDSWAHYSDTYSISTGGEGITALGSRWKSAVIGGEVAYDWGNYAIRPGKDPNDTLGNPDHLEFFLDTIYKYHCNHLGTIGDYDRQDRTVAAGAEKVQDALGYRFVVDEVRYPAKLQPGEEFELAFTVRNSGASPFYYRWPVEASLLDPITRQPVWRGVFSEVDIRNWLPGDQWRTLFTTYDVRQDAKDAAGNPIDEATMSEHEGYAVAPLQYRASGTFTLPKAFRQGEYILALAILDPAGMLPSARFAMKNYFTGGHHPIGMVGVGKAAAKTELDQHFFDDVQDDRTLHYRVEERYK